MCLERMQTFESKKHLTFRSKESEFIKQLKDEFGEVTENVIDPAEIGFKSKPTIGVTSKMAAIDLDIAHWLDQRYGTMQSTFKIRSLD